MYTSVLEEPTAPIFRVEEQATYTREHEKEEPQIDQLKTHSLDKKRPNV
jgi:hypothetical protein